MCGVGAPPATAASEPAATVDVSDNAPPAVVDGLTAKLQELKLAGGDLPALAALAARDRTELMAALKELGFKGLKSRNELEQDLKAWQAAQ